jgi:5-methylthioribose kinase
MSLAPAVDLTTSTALEYLKARGVSAGRVVELAGGVSNTVLLVEAESARFVLKQSLPQLRVEQHWVSDLTRIWREASALEALASCLPAGSIPEVLFRDDENYLFAMAAAPPECESWKAALLRGECDPAVAGRAGSITAAMMRAGWRNPAIEKQFGDLTVFTQLRLDPYYRTAAGRNPDLAAFFLTLAKTYPSHCCTLVHGDWSPKNFLVGGGAVMAIDFEAVHFGDPAFDAAFLLNHLLLKFFHLPDRAPAFAGLARTFWTTLTTEMPPIANFELRTITHLGALLLSRLDGKSPAEYIRDAGVKQQIREFARQLILTPPSSVLRVFER